MVDTKTAVQQVREALEDMIMANLEIVFLKKNGMLNAVAGDNNIVFSGEIMYSSSLDYEVRILSALDAGGVDVKNELKITKTSGNGFKINAYRPCTIHWQSARIAPLFTYHETYGTYSYLYDPETGALIVDPETNNPIMDPGE